MGRKWESDGVKEGRKNSEREGENGLEEGGLLHEVEGDGRPWFQEVVEPAPGIKRLCMTFVLHLWPQM